MSSAPIQPIRPPTARLEDSKLFLDRFIEEDPSVIEVLKRSPDVEAGTHRLLRSGAMATMAAASRLDELTLDQAVGRMNDEYRAALDDMVQALVGQDGAAPRLIAGVQADLTRQIVELFDPGRRESAYGQLQELFKVAGEHQLKELRTVLDPDDGSSPLGRWRSQVVNEVREYKEAVSKEVQALSTALAVRQGQQEERQRGTAKGVQYEDFVAGVLSDIACQHGDVTEPVGRKAGSAAALTGDAVVTLNSEDTGTQVARIVIEAKNRRLSLRRALDELSAAMENRDAQAGIVVFASQHQAPITVPVAYFEDKVVVVLDEEEPDERSLALAYMAARWVARRKLVLDTDGVDPAAVETLLGDAGVALERASAIRRCHSAIRKNAEQASTELTSLVAEVDEAMRQLRKLFG